MKVGDLVRWAPWHRGPNSIDLEQWTGLIVKEYESAGTWKFRRFQVKWFAPSQDITNPTEDKLELISAATRK